MRVLNKKQADQRLEACIKDKRFHGNLWAFSYYSILLIVDFKIKWTRKHSNKDSKQNAEKELVEEIDVL